MENFYFLLNLDKNMSIEDIKSSIEKQKKKYIKMLNSPKIEKQAEAQNKLELLESADKIFVDEDTKKAYDMELDQSKPESETNYNANEKHQYHQTQENDEYSIYFDQAVEAIQRTDGAAALSAATKVFNLMPNDKGANYLMAHAHYTFGNIADARQYLNATIKIDPTFDAAYFDLGKILIDHYSDYDQGLLKLEQCLKINPGNEETLLYLGDLYNGQNDLTSAKQFLEQLVQYHPNNHSYQTKLKEVKDRERLKNSLLFENAADNIYKKGYFNDEEEYKQYIKFLNTAKSFHVTPMIEEKIFQGRKKEDFTIDFRTLSYFFLLSLAIEIFSGGNQGLNFLFSIIIGVCASYIIYNAIIPKWKLEQRRKTKIRTWWQIGLIYFFAVSGTLIFAFLLLLNFQVVFIMGIMYAIFKYGLPKLNKKKVEEAEEE